MLEIDDIPSEYWGEIKIGLVQEITGGSQPLSANAFIPEAPPETYWYTLSEVDSASNVDIILPLPDLDGNYQIDFKVFLCHDSSSTAAATSTTQNASVALLIFMLSWSLAGTAIVLRTQDRWIPAVVCWRLGLRSGVVSADVLNFGPSSLPPSNVNGDQTVQSECSVLLFVFQACAVIVDWQALESG